MAQALSVSDFNGTSAHIQAVTHLCAPLRNLSTVPAVAAIFKSTDTDKQTVQEKVAAEMDILYVAGMNII